MQNTLLFFLRIERSDFEPHSFTRDLNSWSITVYLVVRSQRDQRGQKHPISSLIFYSYHLFSSQSLPVYASAKTRTGWAGESECWRSLPLHEMVFLEVYFSHPPHPLFFYFVLFCRALFLWASLSWLISIPYILFRTEYEANMPGTVSWQRRITVLTYPLAYRLHWSTFIMRPCFQSPSVSLDRKSLCPTQSNSRKETLTQF